MNELISVIVPVYNVEKYLERCVKSILRQTYTNLEIILVDDGSPDKSGKICDELANKDARISVIHKKNGGASSSRNAGIEFSHGEFICFVDSDDYIEKDYVMTLYNLIKRNNADLAKINYVEVNTDDYSEQSKDEKEKVFLEDDVEYAYLALKVDSACVFLYRRDLIGNTRFEVGKTSEDILFNFEIFKKAKKLVYLPANKYYYFYNIDSVSNGLLDRNMMNYLYCRKNIYEYYCATGNAVLITKSEALYARAAMGLMTRMTVYGISDELSEKECRILFKNEFMLHKKVFFKDDDIPISRKIMAIGVFYFYPVVKFLAKFIKY